MNLVVLIQGLEEDEGARGVQVEPEFRIVNVNFWGATEKTLFLPSPPELRSRNSEFRLWLQIRPRLRIVLQDTLKMAFFDLTNRIKIVTIYKNFLSNHDFFFYEISVILERSQSWSRSRNIISALAPSPGGNLISAPLLSAPAPQTMFSLSHQQPQL